MCFYFIALFSFFTLSLQAQQLDSYRKVYFNKNGQVLPYRFLYPDSFDAAKKYPLLIFLHGANARGTDNEAQLDIGGRFFLRDSVRKKYPSFILFPQCPENDVWAYFETDIDSAGHVKDIRFPFKKEPTFPTALLKSLLDSMTLLSFIDTNRVYIGGLSQGGMGVFDMAARHPELFAAAFPICGAGKPSTADRFGKQTAWWIFHGKIDDVIPVIFSRQFNHKLKRRGIDVRYSEYPNARHDSWVNAFGEPELLSWIFSKSKK